MLDPSIQQAVGYAQWYLLRGATEAEIADRLLHNDDHSWLSQAERQAVITEAQGNIKALRSIWEKLPHIKPELSPSGFLKRPNYRRTRKNQRGEN